VAKLPRIINVGSIEMTSAAPRPGVPATVRVTCTAMTFVLTEPRPGAPAPAVPAKKTE
jgi:Tfp pilus assembly protein PilO